MAVISGPLSKENLKMKKQKVTFTAITLALGCLVCLPQIQARLRTEAIRTSPRQKGPKPFSASPPDLRTQPLVGIHSLATQQAASIPLPARGRSFSTPQTEIRHLARLRFYSIPPASTTPPLALPPF